MIVWTTASTAGVSVKTGLTQARTRIATGVKDEFSGTTQEPFVKNIYVELSVLDGHDCATTDGRPAHTHTKAVVNKIIADAVCINRPPSP